ncbi:DEAD-box ATP-dependent RNA helicase 13 [Fasciolopsis buskii]|uniref:ATP-dependent RNA helicase n=1 Tax=Fasciolopsis buskii TaxID=27845 RepID=A0A8E0RRW1_9TREM|nr:DEAD-box ATP-dependent RNA helicase 13 [Fasciolopsis buski]
MYIFVYSSTPGCMLFMEHTEESIEEVWRRLFVPDNLIQALIKASFLRPTPIQSCVLPAAIRDHSDILGSAPTGSGKTLAFAIPLLTRVMELRLREQNTVISPTETVDVSMRTSMTEKDRETGKTSSKKRLSSGAHFDLSFTQSHYLNLATIEELDADTGEVKAIHSLVDQTIADTKVTKSIEGGAEPKEPQIDRVYALVLLPTRELALQVCHHLRMFSEFVEPRIRIEAIVGGISLQKQARLLSYKPHVIVATPGRLWQFIQQVSPFCVVSLLEDEPHLRTLRSANFLVVDEADRLMESNHFEDLRELFTWLSANSSCSSTKVDRSRLNKRRQIAVFSATLTFVHRGALKPGSGAKRKPFKNREGLTRELKLNALRNLFGLSPRAKVFDLSSKTIPSNDPESDALVEVQDNPGSVAPPDGLHEYRFLCTDQPSKDMRLFWFLAFGRHQAVVEGRSPANQRCLIFINSKSGVRRLAGVMRQLMQGNTFGVSGHPQPRSVNVLHADMLQKHRLRALERFQADPNGILLASDVAARGLDLASEENTESSNGVAWVIHFDVPHTAELYIHRRGRTARAYRTGTSVLLICPDEIPLWKRLALNLKLVDPDLPDFPTEPTQFQLTACEKLVEMARKLDLTEHTESRKRANNDWFAQAAKSADILLESDENGHSDDE